MTVTDDTAEPFMPATWEAEFRRNARQTIKMLKEALKTKDDEGVRYLLRLNEIVLKYGEGYSDCASSDAIPFCKKWKQKFRPKAKDCFANAQQFVIDNLERKVRYVEGFVLIPNSNFPQEHAWNLLEDGRVVDFTMEHLDRITKKKHDWRYFGIELDSESVVDIVTTGDVFDGLLVEVFSR